MKKYILTLVAIFTLGFGTAQAQWSEHKGLIWSTLHGLEYEFKAGVNIGGTSPLPLPHEIRSLDSYSPGLAITIEGNATKWIDEAKKWGVSVGLRLDSKSMTTEATVKNYGMEILSETGGKIQGLWTGGVKTKVKMSLLTVPILANYKIRPSPHSRCYRKPRKLFRRQHCDIRLFGRPSSFPMGIAVRRLMESLQTPHCTCRPYMGTERHLPKGF